MKTTIAILLFFSTTILFGQQINNSILDSNEVLTTQESNYLDSLFQKTNPPLHFSGKRIAFVVKPEVKIVSKKDFFANYIDSCMKNNSIPHLTIQGPFQNEKKQYGGYDYIFVWPSGGFTKKENEKLLKLLLK